MFYSHTEGRNTPTSIPSCQSNTRHGDVLSFFLSCLPGIISHFARKFDLTENVSVQSFQVLYCVSDCYGR